MGLRWHTNEWRWSMCWVSMVGNSGLFPFLRFNTQVFFIPKNGGSVTWCTKIFTVVKYIIYWCEVHFLRARDFLWVLATLYGWASFLLFENKILGESDELAPAPLRDEFLGDAMAWKFYGSVIRILLLRGWRESFTIMDHFFYCCGTLVGCLAPTLTFLQLREKILRLYSK